MKNFAYIENNIVINISVADDDWFSDGWIQSDEAQIGWTYANGIFTSPQPYPSWTLLNNEWHAPIDKPDDGKFYSWNEDSQAWTERVIG